MRACVCNGIERIGVGTCFSSGFVEVNPNSIPTTRTVQIAEPVRVLKYASFLVYLAEIFAILRCARSCRAIRFKSISRVRQ